MWATETHGEVVDAEADFGFIIDLVYQRARIRLHDGKQSLIRARLGKRMRHLGIQSLAEYCRFLQRPEGQEEITQTIDALTTNFTRFLREEDHLRFVVNEAIPTLTRGGQRRLRLWSAACATGEEPYSLAIYLAEHYPTMAGWDWRVAATDISTKALAKARSAIYEEERLQDLPDSWLRRYFQRGQGEWDGHCRVKSWLRERIEFSHLNLLGTYPFTQPFDVIFCRNVMIYFDRQTQQELLRALDRVLVQGGYLVVGHSESLNGLSMPLRSLRPSIYRKE